ncbi:MAG: hypothetical protein ABIR81_00935 [Ginsengibacter sp.]
MKLKILLNWDTSRKDLFEPFITLKSDFEFVVLYNRSPSNKPSIHPFKEIYFDSFLTPYDVLRLVKPDRIIFFNINSFPQIALNRAAKNIGIQTFLMHHGIHSSDVLRLSQVRADLGLDKKSKHTKSFKTLLFYLLALRFKNYKEFWKYLRFPITMNKNHRTIALHKSSFDAILPTKIIQLSPYNSKYTKSIYGFIDDKIFVYIGHPSFDKIIHRFKELVNSVIKRNNPYFLLIDFPNIENNMGYKIVGFERKLLFYKKLASAAKQHGCRLKIKLHPAGYDSELNYVDDSNIDIITETDIAKLIFEAKVCLSFYSTLLIPIIYQKKFCYVFHFGLQIGLQTDLVELGLVKLLSLDDFTAEDLHSDNYFLNYDAQSYKTFIDRYLYFVDGKSTERLKMVLEKGDLAKNHNKN